MTSKRDLKKMVKRVCGDLAGECMMAATFVKGVDPQKMIDIVATIAALQDTSLDRLNFSFDKQPRDFAGRAEYNKAHRAYFKAAYRAFEEKFLGHVQEIVKAMNDALPQEVKDANVKK